MKQILADITPVGSNNLFVTHYWPDKQTDPPLHYHEDYMLCLTLHVRGQRIMDDAVEDFTEKDLVLINPGTPHRFKRDAAYADAKCETATVELRNSAIMGAGTLWEDNDGSAALQCSACMIIRISQCRTTAFVNEYLSRLHRRDTDEGPMGYLPLHHPFNALVQIAKHEENIKEPLMVCDEDITLVIVYILTTFHLHWYEHGTDSRLPPPTVRIVTPPLCVAYCTTNDICHGSDDRGNGKDRISYQVLIYSIKEIQYVSPSI